jgi:hypothetical protein
MIQTSISMNFATRVKMWHVARLYIVLYELYFEKLSEYDTCIHICGQNDLREYDFSSTTLCWALAAFSVL